MNLFDYLRPGSVDEAVQAGLQPGAAFLAGGTNLLDLMKIGVAQPGTVVDITRLPGLDGIEALPGGGWKIGALVRNADLARDPAFAAACQEIGPWSTAVRNEFELRLTNELGGIEVIGKNGPRLPNTTCIRFEGCEADGLLMGLDIQGIGVSTGSACSTGSIEPSRILLAMGLSVEEAKSCIRFSFPKELTSEDLERVVRTISELVGRMRRV